MKKFIWISICSLVFTLTAQAQKNKQSTSPTKPKLKLNVEQTTASGLKVKLLQEGKGTQATKGSTVAVHYVGTLTDGKKFDSSRDRGQPIKFKLGEGRVIKGWDEGIAMLRVGDKALFTIPAELGYGSREIPNLIPANSTLVFEVELMDVVAPPKPFDVAGKDTITTASGLKYIVVSKTKDAAAVKAEAGKTVSVHYTGMLTDGRIFDSSIERGTPIQFPLGQGNVIKGWDEGIALMQIGDKLRLIIPAELGYGAGGSGPIPPNSTLIFDVELMGVQ